MPLVFAGPSASPAASFAFTFQKALRGFDPRDERALLRRVNSHLRDGDERTRAMEHLTRIEQLADPKIVEVILQHPELFEVVTEELDIELPFLRPIVEGFRKETDPERIIAQLKGVRVRIEEVLRGGCY